MNEKLHELELLLQSRDHKIQFLEEEHKNEVLRAAKAEDVTKTYRYDKIDGKNLKHYKDKIEVINTYDFRYSALQKNS